MLRKSFIQVSADRWVCVPPFSLARGGQCDPPSKGLMEHTRPLRICCSQCPDPAAGYRQLMPPPETQTLYRQVWLSPCGANCLFSLGLVLPLFVPSKSFCPVLWKSSYNQIPLAFQNQILGILVPLLDFPGCEIPLGP